MALVIDSTVAATLRLHSSADATTAVEIVVPVHNEERGLEDSIRALHTYLRDHFTVTWAITIADNASTDRTWAIAQRLAATLYGVRSLHLDGRGGGARCARRGARARPLSSRTWTSICRPISTLCSRSSRRCV